MKKPLLTVVLFSIASYLALILWLITNILRKTGGHFVYALDDPYIHLALAENLAHGHYGINLAEYSSPSSSLLWPFLLIPLNGTHLHQYVPLLWNLLFGVIAAGLIGYTVARWSPIGDERRSPDLLERCVLVVLLLFCANLASLTIVGMEHVLQVLLAICCAIGVAEALDGRAVPGWCIAAALIAPSVRYDALSVTLALCVAVAASGAWKKAAAIFGASLLPLVGFSAFLRSRGLPLLPLSVLVKGGAFSKSGPAKKIAILLKTNLHDALTDVERLPLLFFFLIFAGMAWSAETRARRMIYAGAAAVGLLQLTIGRFGWFARYEVFALVFLAIVCLRMLRDRPLFIPGYLSLSSGALLFVGTTILTSQAAVDVYDQQYQMRRFVTQFYQGNYGVNDLGLVSFGRRPGSYVLDYGGLASEDASRHWDKPARWMTETAAQHQVALAILYPDLFHIPREWTPVARMCNPVKPIIVYGQCVVFYSTEPQETATILAEVKAFAPTLPKGDSFYLREERTEDRWVLASGPADSSGEVHDRQEGY